MDSIIYSASPLQAFSGSIVVIGIMLLIGLLGAFAALAKTKRKSQRYTNIMAGCASIVLFLAVIGMSIVTYNSYKNGDKTIQVRLTDKEEVTRKCGERNYCTDYNLETTDGNKYYVFGVNKDVWDVMKIESCYEFTYYPAKPLLADYIPQDDLYSEYYEPTGTIAQIKSITCP